MRLASCARGRVFVGFKERAHRLSKAGILARARLCTCLNKFTAYKLPCSLRRNRQKPDERLQWPWPCNIISSTSHAFSIPYNYPYNECNNAFIR